MLHGMFPSPTLHSAHNITKSESNMSRKAQIRYWQRQGGGYFTTRNGEQIRLALGPDDFPDGPTYTEAMAAWLKLTQPATADTSPTVRQVVGLYRHYLTGKDKRLVKNLDGYVLSFVEMHPDLRVSQIKRKHVSEWVSSKPSWNSSSTRRTAIGYLKSALQWWADEEQTANPLASLKLPRATRRGREARMSAELMDLLESVCRYRQTLQLIRFLRWTGARPIEIVRARGPNFREGQIVHRWNARPPLYIHKTAAKTERDRVITIPPFLRSDIEKQVEVRGDNFLFCTPRGKQWSNQSICREWGKLKRHPLVKAYLNEHGISAADMKVYNYRHTFISDMLDMDTDIYAVAHMTGTSVKMIEDRYGHPDAGKIALKCVALVERLRQRG